MSYMFLKLKMIIILKIVNKAVETGGRTTADEDKNGENARRNHTYQEST